MVPAQVLDYYRQQSTLTDPGICTQLYVGMPPIRYALLHDFAALNKCEVLGNDDWGELITKPEADLTSDEIALLDRIAEVTTHTDTQFDELRTLFEESSYGRTVLAHL